MGLASSLKNRVAKLGKSVVQGHRASTDAYVAHLKNIGVKMGDDVVIFSPGRTNIDEQNPHLLSFGSHVAMTGPVTILTHDYSVGVTKVWTHGEILGSQKPVSIGSNVFLGWGCTVLPGTTIGDNCIVGAGSVVSGNVEGGSVWGGVPGKRICSLEEYYERRKSKQLEEACTIYRLYKERFSVTPPIEVFHEYFYLFTTSSDGLCERFRQKLDDHENADECLRWIDEHEHAFGNYEEFCEYAEGRLHHT